ncbi:MAG TPA: MlaD family protein [Solirubrobacteraceae bacterium]|jgi:phospholipid/cholesterol/gamma-HCH transport system substrate-binding protein
MLAVGALALVVLLVAYILFSGGGGTDYKLVFAEADQLVRGDQVQVGGVPVGSIKDIVLTHDFKARITIHVDSSLTPLHEGTTAQIRVPSLTSVANRYIALTPGPNNRRALADGATVQTSATSLAVDLDQLFNTFDPKTRKGLQQVFQGSAEQYAGAGSDFRQSTKYFGPSIASTDHLFSELVRDQPTFTNFLVESSKAVSTIGARSGALTDLIENTNKTFQAIGARQTSLAQALRQLPTTLRQGNRTFADLPSTLSALKQLVDVSKPNTKTLAGFFAKLHPLVTAATPVVGNLSLAIDRPGPGNDLTDAVRAIPTLARVLSTSSPATVTALKESVPITAFFGPYSPDLQGFIRDFGEGSAYYDANGHYARANPIFDSFKLGSGNRLTPVTPQQGVEGLKTLQLRRCPGAATQPAADGSSPFTDNGLLSCDPSQVP